MQKINFTDTTITQKPYVTINNVNYEVQDGIYTGGTDLNAQTFNTMQSNIEQAINAIYPVGSIIIRDDTEDMSNFLGFTWEKVFAGRVLVGLDTTQTEFDTIGKTGGEKTHKLTIDEMPSHTHDMDDAVYGNYKNRLGIRGDGGGGKNLVPSMTQTDGYSKYLPTDTGGGKGHSHGDTGSANHLPPYLAVYMWKRIA